MQTLLQDLRYGMRILRKSPGITAVAIITLALGIGATTAIFAFVNAGLIHPLPYRDPGQLVRISMTKRGEFGEMEAAYPNYLDWKAQNTSFQSMAGYAQSGDILWSGGGTPEALDTAIVSANFFSTLGVEPALGRAFSAEDEQKRDTLATVVSYGSWKKRFGGRNDILGQSVRLGDKSYVIVGVLPRSFEFVPAGAAEMFVLPPATGGVVQRRNLHWFNVLARLKPGVSISRAASEMQAISDHLAELYPQSNRDTGTRVVPLREIIVGKVRPVLLLLFAAAGFVLLIACANVANVLLAKAAGRTQEMAVRVALGAPRSRIVRQLLTESVLLALIAGVASVVVAQGGAMALIKSVPAPVRESMPFLESLSITPALAFTAVISLFTGILFGLAPALRAPAVNLHLADGGRTMTGSKRQLRSVLVVSEIGIAVALLIVTGLLLKSLWRVVHVDPGFNRHNLLLMGYALPPARYDQDAKQQAFNAVMEQRITTLPGVQGVAQTNRLPLSDCDNCNTVRFRVEGQPAIESAAQPEASTRSVGAQYFPVLQARLLKGRLFNDRDRPGAPPVLIVNRALAEKYFGGDAVGKHLTFTFAPGQPAREIVGVVDNLKEGFLDSEDKPALYSPRLQNLGQFGNLVVRTGGDPAAMADAVRRALLDVEPNAAIFSVTTMDARVADSTPMFLRQLPALLVSIFGTLALLLAAIGIYGVISYSVAQRTREFGVRMALGASTHDLLRLVLSAGMRLTLTGIVIGIVAGAALARVASGMLFAVRAVDYASFAVAALVVAAVALLASYIPAQRAAKLDPMAALRYE